MSPANGLDWQVLQFPLAGGLDTKRHSHAVDPPSLVSAINVEFDEVGSLRLRRPYASIGANIYGGGTLSNVRKLAAVGDELLAFTDTGLYSWSEALTAWVYKAEHLAVAVTETPRFGNPNDQVFVDRAQLGGVIVYVWTEIQSGNTERSYLAAVDATTGATLIAPTYFGANATRPRVIATDTKIMVFWQISGTGLVVGSVTPSAPVFAGGILSLVSANLDQYDVIKGPAGGSYSDQVFAVTHNALGTNYTVCRITTAGVVTTANKTRPATGCLKLAVPPSGDVLQVIRQDTTNIVGDQLTQSTLADVNINTAIGSAPASIVSQVTGAFRSTTTGGYYRCYVFWSVDEGDAVNDNPTSGVYSNWVDTNNATGTQGAFVFRQSLVSHAFEYGGRVFVWTSFAVPNNAGTEAVGLEVAVQNSNFLHRDDGDYFAKATWNRAGGAWWKWNAISQSYDVQYTGHLPGVAAVSGTTGYAWATTERGYVELNGRFPTKGYAARSPRDVVFTFDHDDARRVVQLGRTAYVSGGLVQQYDGEGLAEVGFEQFPWSIQAADDATAGLLAAGKYTYKTTLRWDNARGEIERSTTTIAQQLTVGANRKPKWWASRLRVTKKTGSRRPPAIECWRTQVNPTVDAPFYLVTSRDPATTGDNCYVANSVAYTGSAPDQRDNLPDTELIGREANPETSATLPRFAPPPGSILIAGDARLFLAGVPAEPFRIWYSLARSEGEVAAFHPALVVDLPAATGPITALAIMDGTLIAWTATACYALSGEGFDNIGGGNNYGPPRLISGDVGALSHDALALTPGGVVFASRKGWYQLGRGWDMQYVGAPIERLDAGAASQPTWLAAQVVESQHQVRVISNTSMFAWDYLVNQWAEWSPWHSAGALLTVSANALYRDLAVWRGKPLVCNSTTVSAQQTGYGLNNYDLELETGWIKLNGLQGFGRVRWVMLLVQAQAQFALRVRVAYNYAATYTDDRSITVTPGTAGDGMQVRIGPSQQRVEALKLSISVDGTSFTGDPPTFTGLALEVGLKSGIYRRVPASMNK